MDRPSSATIERPCTCG